MSSKWSDPDRTKFNQIHKNVMSALIDGDDCNLHFISKHEGSRFDSHIIIIIMHAGIQQCVARFVMDGRIIQIYKGFDYMGFCTGYDHDHIGTISDGMIYLLRKAYPALLKDDFLYAHFTYEDEPGWLKCVKS